MKSELPRLSITIAVKTPMLKEMDQCGFGNCTNHRVCENACPKEVSITHIARFNREFLKAALFAKAEY